MSTTGYNRPNEDQEGSSGVENDTKDSEVEALSSVEDASSEVPKDYWFGKKYFEFVLAQDLLSRTPLHEPVPDIDVSHTSIIIRMTTAKDMYSLIWRQRYATFRSSKV